MNTEAFLLLGSNVGSRDKNLVFALNEIEIRIGSIREKSSVYETAPWGRSDQPPFLNQVVAIDTQMNPHVLLDELLAIEGRMGRLRNEKWAERIIDIDILLYGDEIIETEHLVIPHPQLALRRFTLIPLNEIAPELMHPKLARKISELLSDCTDPLSVVRVAIRNSH